MRAYDVKERKYQDRLVEKRRRILILKILFFLGLAIAIAGFLFYLLFFSKLLDVNNISINGLDQADKDGFSKKLDTRLGSKWLGYIERQKNIIFFDSKNFKAEILLDFPEIKNLSIQKKLPHTLDISITERKMIGIWCFVNNCKYFDEEGKIWGEAAQSSGFLILNVDDLRLDQGWSREIADKNLFNVLMFVSQHLKDIDILVNRFIIPQDYVTDFRVITSRHYALLFSTDSNIKEQLEIFKIFLAEKQNEPNFRPQYIDLRVNGRVYFK